MIGSRHKDFLEEVLREVKKGNVRQINYTPEKKYVCFLCRKRIGEEIYLVAINEQDSITKVCLDKTCYFISKNFFYG